ncbi:Multiple epidermal growth factor-like domains protein 8 [Boothiomyces sp. JEL0866]|nr:Multiple epidermal growth factor-like domains protein 8 [Boothiomyces sp. JEL0866]
MLNLLILALQTCVESSYCSPYTAIKDVPQGYIYSQTASSYLNNAQCKWYITSSDPGAIIKLSFVYFDTECGYDYVYISNDYAQNTAIAQLCGNRFSSVNLQNTFVSDGNSLAITFLSDDSGTRRGFNASFEILSSNHHCRSNAGDCGLNGLCSSNGTCSCLPNSYGKLCQYNSTGSSSYSPRERHSVAHDSLNDIVYLTFGADWNNLSPIKSDFWSYNFNTNNWTEISISNPPARVDHYTWFHNSKLYLFGGYTNYDIYHDMWVYDPTLNKWAQINTLSFPLGLQYTVESAIVFVPKQTSFDLYIYGGIDGRTYNPVLSLYRYNSISNAWVQLRDGPAGYEGAKAIYISETNSVRIISGYPVNDQYYNNQVLYTFEYSIDSDMWLVVAPRSVDQVRYQSTVTYIGNSYGAVYGGLLPASSGSCFESSLQILDLACNQWNILDSTVHRKGQAGIARNQSLYIFGGNDGLLHNDIIEIPLQLASTNQSRDICKGYCGYNLDSFPLGGLNTTSVIQPETVCLNYDKKSCQKLNLTLTGMYSSSLNYGSFQDFYYSTLNDLEADIYQIQLLDASSYANLRITVIEVLPYTPTSLSGLLFVRNPMPDQDYITIRISWANDKGAFFSPTDFNTTVYDTSKIGSSSPFTLRISKVMAASPGYHMDYFTLISLILISLFSIFILYNRIRRNRQLRNERIAMQLLHPLPKPRKFFKFEADLSLVTGDPLGIEIFDQDTVAHSYLILQPGAKQLLDSGDMLKYHIGTRCTKISPVDIAKFRNIFRRPTIAMNAPSRSSDLATRDAFLKIGEIIRNNQNDFAFLQQNTVLTFNYMSYVQPNKWLPNLEIPAKYGASPINLVTLEIFPLKPSPISFKLESKYKIEKVLPRSFFGILYQLKVGHTFVFNLANPDVPNSFIQELTGMRQSTYVKIVETNTSDDWELHLKPSKGVIFGYLCKPADIRKVIEEQSETFLRTRKLPLVLDLDDTLVRVVGNAPGRYVPEQDIEHVMHRVRELKDGRKVVLADRVHEFLNWASNLYEISLCSLGDQPYVDMVAQILNQESQIIRGGVAYSARGEYLYLTQNGSSPNARRPPKDLNSLFAFYTSKSEDVPFVEPLILDDNATMWPMDQQDNIIVIREMVDSKVWNVALFPVVQQVLAFIHENYFKQLDIWNASDPAVRGPPPTSLTFYKEYMRKELSSKIAEISR